MARKFTFNPYKISALGATLALPLLLVWAGTTSSEAASSDTAKKEPTLAELEKQFTQTVRPFLQTYCTDCHGKDKPQAQLDLASYKNVASVVAQLPHWSLVMERLHAKDMPPSDYTKRPTVAQREAVIAWIRAVRQREITRTAGDPGPVLARRLSNREYDYTIRDLTGVDLRPTKEFPVDPANQEGFDNSGESLTFSSALAKKYLAAAKEIGDHLALTSTGLAFASHPVLGQTDRDKFCTQRIVAFYKSQPTDLADYFFAAWQLKRSGATVESVAAEQKVSAKYLGTIWRLLKGSEHPVGPVATLRKKFEALPESPEEARKGSMALRDWVVGLRRNKIAWRFGNLSVPREFRTGSFTNVLWKDRQYAAHRFTFNPKLLQVGGVPAKRPAPVKGGSLGQVQGAPTFISDPVDPDLFVPADEAERAAYLASFETFSSIFPDIFYIEERGLMESDNIYQHIGRFLTGGTHNAVSYFRDDAPLRELILDEKGQKELDALWSDFGIIAAYNRETYLQGIFYEGLEAQTILAERDPEFNFAPFSDKATASAEKIQRYCELYLAKAKRMGATPETLAAYEDYFKWSSANIRQEERERLAAESVHKKAVLEFAQKAFRRPLAPEERSELLGFYTRLRQKENLAHEDAIRDTVVWILMSPSFLFRLDQEPSPSPAKPAKGRILTASQAAPAPAKTQPLSDYALASRLSYFLWSSSPDDELLALAAKGELRKPAVLVAQAQRMLKSPKTRALATEFGGNWLDFRRFEEHNAVDKTRFPSFDDTLRQSMFEEPLHFMLDTFQNNGSILDWLFGKHTFVNGPLAKHYGMDNLTLPPGMRLDASDWVRVPDADKYGRGGLLPMALFLTQNASGLRTSPVKRGYWVVRRVLGEQIPPPPAKVPELPKDESELGEKTLRQALEIHRKNPACSGCHARFDSYGLVFENFGPIGERRTKDGGGKLVDNRAPFPGGKEFAGVEGLQDFLRLKRQQDFVGTFSRKMLSYALGRTLLPSDEPLLAELSKRLSANNYRFSPLVEGIVTSPQFRNRRVAPVTSTKDI
jgi:mono/diheme cytochrome c family protein